jgi:hypothetical protein
MTWDHVVDRAVERFRGGPQCLQNMICHAEMWSKWHDMAIREFVHRSCLTHRKNFHELTDSSNRKANLVEAFSQASMLDDVLFISDARLSLTVVNFIALLSDEIYRGDMARIGGDSLRGNYFRGLIIACCSTDRLDKFARHNRALCGRVSLIAA